MKYVIYIGIDDTDTLGSVGTGRVAKGLAAHLLKLLPAESLGVSRHQLLVDSRIKYTSHNSSKGLALVTERPAEDFSQPAIDYMKSCFVPGSDPGLCICPEDRINPEIMDYALSSQKTVLSKEQARQMAAKYNIFLRELGGDGGGIIGALAAVGLRAGGNDGRLVELKGIHDIKGLISAGELRELTDIASIQDPMGMEVRDEEIIDSLDWIRPTLIGGRPVLRIQLLPGDSRGRIWQALEVKHKKKVVKGDQDE
jgi:hypothetical protein